MNGLNYRNNEIKKVTSLSPQSLVIHTQLHIGATKDLCEHLHDGFRKTKRILSSKFHWIRLDSKGILLLKR